MRIRHICARVLMIAALGLFVPHGAAVAAEQTPEGLVRDFYLWYIKKESSILGRKPVLVADDAMYDYVSPCAMAKCRMEREKGILEADYFIQANDVWPEWTDGMVVHAAIPLDAAVCLVPVTFGESVHKQLLVFVKKEKGAWRIIKVEDAE